MSKEMKNKRMSITWEQKQRQCTPLRAMRKSQKVISRTRQRHSFHKKRFLTAHAGTREREAYKRVSRQPATQHAHRNNCSSGARTLPSRNDNSGSTRGMMRR